MHSEKKHMDKPVVADVNVEKPVSEQSSPRSATLAKYLETAIIDGEFKLGEPLPSERELMSRFDVSRATVREALRILGAQGLTTVKRGRNGGSYVSGPNGSSLKKSLELFIRGHNIRYIDLVAVREAIEPVAAGLAAKARTDQDLELLHELSAKCEESVRDIDAFVKYNSEWHMAVLQCSHNPLFYTFMSSISDAFVSATNREEFEVNTRKVVVQAHWQIFRAIRDGDAEAAQRRMLKHVTAYGERLEVSVSN